MTKSYLLVCVIAFSSPAFAQRQTVDQSAQWFTLHSLFRVSDRYSIMAEGQFRYVNDFQPMQFQARTGLDVHVSKQFTFIPLGYVYTWNPIYGKQPAKFSNNEHRIFQQVQFTHSLGRFHFGHRARLEQRFIQVHNKVNGETVSDGYTFYLNRLRYRLQVQIALNNKEITPGTIYASIYDEAFLDFGPNVIYTDPDQNRLFIGAGYKFDSRTSLQVGFFDQTLIKLSGTMQENNVGFQAVLLWNVDLRRGE